MQAAAAAAGAQQYPAGALYVVATPIGNLADLSLRAIHVLALADLVACEDTRTSGALLAHLGLARPTLALHQHNEAQAAATVCEHLAAGWRVAVVSDAGTPAVSDPGARVVAAAHAAGHRVVPVPGASSALAALSAAGDARGAGFSFTGFLPARGAERREAVRHAARAPGTQVLFEAPHRVHELALALAAEAPARTLTLCRELTKQFETVCTMTAAQLPPWLDADPNRLRGEFVIVLHALAPPAPGGPEDALGAEARRTLQVLLRELPLKQAVALATELSGAPRNALYEAALAWKATQADGQRGAQ